MQGGAWACQHAGGNEVLKNMESLLGVFRRGIVILMKLRPCARCDRKDERDRLEAETSAIAARVQGLEKQCDSSSFCARFGCPDVGYERLSPQAADGVRSQSGSQCTEGSKD